MVQWSIRLAIRAYYRKLVAPMVAYAPRIEVEAEQHDDEHDQARQVAEVLPISLPRTPAVKHRPHRLKGEAIASPVLRLLLRNCSGASDAHHSIAF
jgi:hypothetical protein